MDLLTVAADAVFNADALEEVCLSLTPSKESRAVLGEVTNTVNISPERYHNSSLRALLTAPTLSTPNNKSGAGSATQHAASGFRCVGRGSSNGKSLSSPSPGAGNPGCEGKFSRLSSVFGGCGTSPLTPMSNLKLLTRIASMEESLSSKKVLFQSQQNNSENIIAPTASGSDSKFNSPQAMKLRRHKSDSVNPNGKFKKLIKCRTIRKHPSSTDYPTLGSPGNLVLGDSVGKLLPLDDVSQRPEGSRKEKSLGLLSEKFLEHFPMEVSLLETPRRLVIDEVATELGTERRRVYDIINVLESLSMAARVQKNMYQWTGRLHLNHTLARLKALALKMGLHTHLDHLHHHHNDQDERCHQFLCLKSNSVSEGEKTDARREKSLGVLCQKFVMLLLVSPEPHTLSLEHAVRLVVGETGEDGERLRTRGRRLYDIANVLTSLGLLRRVPTAKTFQYIGPQVEPSTSEDDMFCVSLRHSLLPGRVCVDGGLGKENRACPRDQDVTPSTAPPPLQKRGRPRKLSPDFCASTFPVSKRSRLQRTRSEDTASTSIKTTTSANQPNTHNFSRHPSLHHICQVAEVEREKLLQKEQQQKQLEKRAKSADRISVTTVRKIQTATTVSSSQSTKFLPTSLVRRPLGYTVPRPRVPVALTFQTNTSHLPSTHSTISPPSTQHTSTHNPSTHLSSTHPSTYHTHITTHAPQLTTYAPTQPTHTPAHSTHTPIHFIHMPVQSMNTPAQPLHTQAQSLHTPAQSVHTPGHSMHTQVQSLHTPAHSLHTPAHSMHTQAQSSHTPAQSVHTLAHSMHTQAQSSHTPAQSVHTVAHSMHTQAQSSHTPAQSVMSGQTLYTSTHSSHTPGQPSYTLTHSTQAPIISTHRVTHNSPAVGPETQGNVKHNHWSQNIQGANKTYNSLEVLRNQLGIKPIQVGKRAYSGSGGETRSAPVVVVKSGQYHNSPAVIKVITRTEKTANHNHEPSTVITVLPTPQSAAQHNSANKQFYVQTSRGLQPLSVSHKPRVEESSGCEGETSGRKSSPFLVYRERERSGVNPSSFIVNHEGEASGIKSSPFIVSTASGSQITVRKLSRPGASGEMSAPPQLVHVRPRPSDAHTRSGQADAHNTAGPQVQAPTIFRDWQPSPDGSSTDSELEEIFGDSFRFSRPKTLVAGGGSSQEGTAHKME